MKKIFTIFLLVFSVSPFANAEIFKWVDEKGNVNYSDKPASSSVQLNISEEESKPVNKTDEARTERRRKLTEAMTEDRLEKAKKKSKEKKKKEKLNRKCIFAKDRLTNYKRAGSLYKLDKDGNRNTLTEEQHNESIKKLEKNIQKYCK